MSVACCLPLGIPAAAGLAGVGMVADDLQPWFLAASIVLLALGLIQLYRRPACERRNPLTVALFLFAAIIVLAMILFPQSVASFLADRMP